MTDEEKEQLRQATDFVTLVGETVNLRQRGSEFWGCCPFHHERTPSFHVNPTTGLWNCFGCHKGGDVFDYVRYRENLDFLDAARYLADRAGIELSEGRGQRGPRRNRLTEALAAAEGFYETMLLRGRGEGPERARAYLAARGFGADLCRRWHLGFAPGRGALVSQLRSQGYTPEELEAADLAVSRSGRLADRFFDRAMFPIRDEVGRTIGFGGRVLGDGRPKYLNTRETRVFQKSKHLFAFDRAKEQIAARGLAIVVEGYTDVIALHEAGYTNAVGALGTALSLDHLRSLERFGTKVVICMFDGDAAGQRAAELCVQHVDKTRASLRCVVLPDDLDPADFLAERGAEALGPYLRGAQPLIGFVLDRRLAAYDLGVPGQRVAALEDAAELLAPLKNSVMLDSYATELADRLGASIEETKRLIRTRSARRDAQDEGGEYGRVEAMPTRSADVLGALSADERQQILAERELLAMLAANPDRVRPFGERIARFAWADSRHESMAWAMLATPTGTPPAEVVGAASAVVPEAAQILSAGSLAARGGGHDDDTLAFLLDTVELHSLRRQVRALRGNLRQTEGSSDEALALFREVTELQRREGILVRRLAGRDGASGTGA